MSVDTARRLRRVEETRSSQRRSSSIPYGSARAKALSDLASGFSGESSLRSVFIIVVNFALRKTETRFARTVTVIGALNKKRKKEKVCVSHAEAVYSLARGAHFAERFGPPRESSAGLGRATGARPMPHSAARVVQCSSCSRRVFIPTTGRPSEKSPSATGRA